MFCIVSVRGGTWGAGGPHGRRGAVGRGATAPALVWFLRPSAWRRAGDGGQEPWRNAAGSRGTSGLGGSRDTGAPGCRSGGRPHPGDRSVMPLEHTVFTHSPACVAPALCQTRLPRRTAASGPRKSERGSLCPTAPAEGGSQLWAVDVCPEAPRPPGFSRAPP